ncbi:MAG TPA: YdcF family protein [Terracidiphilus sp.]|jgi:vancomycin permeability regulator SanA|nr:YdcF family protein [Terracidiphilus sp.]
MKEQPEPASDRAKPKRPILRWILVLFGLMVLATLAWCRWVFVQIEHYAAQDQASPSDAIAVFGAAEYDGRPSPVFRARLDHAESLYSRGIAPLIITLGGDGGDQFSEGAVGEQYLEGVGVPESDIIAETESTSTDQSVHRLAVIAHTNRLRRIVVVSDGTHLFRIHQICAANGLDVLTSPRPRVPIEGNTGESERVEHEILSYTLWRLHLD